MLTVRSTSFSASSILTDSKSDGAPISQVDLSTLDKGPFTFSLCIDIQIGLSLHRTLFIASCF